jgi:hypothetical protein
MNDFISGIAAFYGVIGWIYFLILACAPSSNTPTAEAFVFGIFWFIHMPVVLFKKLRE